MFLSNTSQLQSNVLPLSLSDAFLELSLDQAFFFIKIAQEVGCVLSIGPKSQFVPVRVKVILHLVKVFGCFVWFFCFKHFVLKFSSLCAQLLIAPGADVTVKPASLQQCHLLKQHDFLLLQQYPDAFQTPWNQR